MAKGITLVFPKGALGPTENDLLEAAVRAIARAYGDKGSWADKYGADVDNDVFMMRPFSWCEQDDCPWCLGEAPNFWYKPLDYKLQWYKFIGRDMEANKELTDRQMAEMLVDCLQDAGFEEPDA